MIAGKIKKKDEMAVISERLRLDGKKIALATGCFDILHSGHIDLLRQAKAYGDILIVGANSDASIKQIKGPLRPIVNEEERLENLASLVFVDYVVAFPETSPADLVSMVKPTFFVKGGDWSGKKMSEEDFLRQNGGKIIFVPVRIKTSTTALHSKDDD